MQPQMRQVPPSAFWRSTTATFRPELGGANRRDIPARARAHHHHVVFARHARVLLHVGSRRPRATGRSIRTRPATHCRLEAVTPLQDLAADCHVGAGSCSSARPPAPREALGGCAVVRASAARAAKADSLPLSLGSGYPVNRAACVASRATRSTSALRRNSTRRPGLREIPAIKDDLQVNVELASPAHFIPELPGWRDRSPFIVREGSIDFHHYDFYAQALAKIERAHARDLEDVREMSARGSHRSDAPTGVLRADRAGTAPLSGSRPGLVPAGRGTGGPDAERLRR